MSIADDRLIDVLRDIDRDIKTLTKTIDDGMRSLIAEINSNFNSTKQTESSDPVQFDCVQCQHYSYDLKTCLLPDWANYTSCPKHTVHEKIEALTDNKTQAVVYCSDCKHFDARKLITCKNGIVLLNDKGCPKKELI